MTAAVGPGCHRHTGRAHEPFLQSATGAQNQNRASPTPLRPERNRLQQPSGQPLIYRPSESRHRRAPAPFSHTASSHHPSLHRGHPGPVLTARSYPSPTTTHLMACIWTEAGGVHGTDAGNVGDPKVCARGTDEGSGLVRLAMKPQ